MIRIRETYGTSWRGRQPGTRHWRSTSVSFPLWISVLWWPFVPFVLFFWALFWLLAGELWLVAEVLLLVISGVLVLADLATKRARPAQITLTRLWAGLTIFDIRSP